MTDRLTDLKYASQIRKLSKDEHFELNALQAAREAAERDPELIQLKQQMYRNQIEQWVGESFRIVVPGRGVPIRNTASEQFVRTWIENLGEQPTLNWWLNLMKDNSLASRLQWTKPLTPAEQKKQDELQTKRLREQALAKCREYGLSQCESNLQILMRYDGTIVRPTHDNNPVLWSGDEEISLVPATPEQIAAWNQEFELKKFNDHQTHLRELAAKGDVTELRKIAAAESADRQLTNFEKRRNYSLLKNFITRNEKDKEPLPTHYRGQPLTAATIKKGGKEVIVDLGKRCGFERINCLLHGFQDIEGFFANAEEKLKTLAAEEYHELSWTR